MTKKIDTIFVGGCMRSGTTILESLICATEATNPVIHECDFIIELAALYRRNKDAFDSRWLSEYFGTEEKLLTYMSSITNNFLDLVRTHYSPAETLVLKNPELTPLLPQVHEICASAKFVVSIRDPRDTIASMVEVAAKLSQNGKKLYVVGEGRDVTAAAHYFNAVYAPVLEAYDKKEFFSSSTLLVRYEDLCNTPQEVANQIAIHCGLDLGSYDPNCDWSRNLISDTTEWSTPLWGKRVSQESIGKHQQVLSIAEIETITNICAPFLERFGYDRLLG